MKLFLLLICFNLCFGYQDEELECLWKSIKDINHPTIDDYRLIDVYLREGKRPYLDEFRNSEALNIYSKRLERIANFQLISPLLAEPIFKTYHFDADETNPRCIVLFSSSNGIYPDKAKKLLAEIESCGYSGHVILRIGGFPNVEAGALKMCHIPYAFKVAALQEAQRLGYKEILWLDLAIHPMVDFEPIFWEIEQRGYFFLKVGSLNDNPLSILPKAAAALKLSPAFYDHIPHISSALLGLNMDDPKAVKLLENWAEEVGKVAPCLTWWPEELSLSAVAWRCGCVPILSLSDFVCGEGEPYRPGVQFYLDDRR